jgi:hypothetical protein
LFILVIAHAIEAQGFYDCEQYNAFTYIFQFSKISRTGFRPGLTIATEVAMMRSSKSFVWTGRFEIERAALRAALSETHEALPIRAATYVPLSTCEGEYSAPEKEVNTLFQPSIRPVIPTLSPLK